MRLARLHTDAGLREGAVIELAAERAHYLARVLRLEAGAPVTVFNDTDGEFAATVETLTSRAARVRVVGATRYDGESPLPTWLVQGLCRGQRMDYCVQKATELGVTRIVPLVARRSVVRLDAAKAERRTVHWRAIAVSASEQSRRTRAPVIERPCDLQAFLARSARPPLAVLDPDEGAALGSWQVGADGVAVMIGPEGGFDADELDAIAAAGAARWRMGPRILRTETAGPVALALVQSRFGDLG